MHAHKHLIRDGCADAKNVIRLRYILHIKDGRSAIAALTNSPPSRNEPFYWPDGRTFHTFE